MASRAPRRDPVVVIIINGFDRNVLPERVGIPTELFARPEKSFSHVRILSSKDVGGMKRASIIVEYSDGTGRGGLNPTNIFFLQKSNHQESQDHGSLYIIWDMSEFFWNLYET